MRTRMGAIALALMLGAGLTAIWGTPAQATPTTSSVTFADNCEGTTVEVQVGSHLGHYRASVAVGEAEIWSTTDPGTQHTEQVDRTAGDITVIVVSKSLLGDPDSDEGWTPRVDTTHTWSEPRRGCARPAVEFEDICTGVKVFLANGENATRDAKFSISVDGSPGLPIAPMPAGNTPEPIHTSGQVITVAEARSDTAWAHTYERPADCDGTPTPNPSVTCSDFEWQEDAQAAHKAGATQLDGDNDGIACEGLPSKSAGAELPQTGTTALRWAGGALILLTAGGVLFALARRRVVRFQA